MTHFADPHTRRDFLQLSTAVGITTLLPNSSRSQEKEKASLAGVVGITTGGGLGRLYGAGKLSLLEMPAYVRTKLGMKLIDLNTSWIKSYEVDDLKRVRDAAETAGCFFTNLKVNHKFGNLYSTNPQEREKAIAAGRKLVDSAKILGTRWIRFFFQKANANDLSGHRELAIYAEQQNIQLLVENVGWMEDQPNSLKDAVKRIGRNVAPCPDTGNWTNDARIAALTNSFPGAVSCDFKVFEFDDQWKHVKYDIKTCFEIGWKAGFRGPWVIENINNGQKRLEETTIHTRELLTTWIAAAQQNS